MRILSVAVKNYKSFHRYNKVRLDNKNIIVGKNGSGKSNWISALFSIFLQQDSKNVHYNKNEEESFIEVEIDNTERLFNSKDDKLFIRKTFHNNSIEYSINSIIVTPAEIKGIFYFCNFNFVEQSFGYITDVEQLLNKVSGVEAVEKAKEQVKNILNTTEIEDMLEKLDYKQIKYKAFVKKYTEFNELDSRRKELEHKIVIDEIVKLNEEIAQFKNEGTSEKSLMDEVKLEEIQNEILLKMKEKQKLTMMTSNINNENTERAEELNLKLQQNELKKETINKQINSLNEQIQKKVIYAQALRYFEASSREREDINELVEKKKNLQRSTISIKNRKEHFMKIQRVKTELSEMNKKIAMLRNRMFYVGNQQVNVYDQIKNIADVYGLVYDLIEVEQTYLKAFEAVAKSSLYYIVVKNREVAEQCIKIIGSKGRVTFIDLDSLRSKVETKINNLDLLADHVKVKNEEHSTLISFLTKNYFVTNDIKKALMISNRHSVDVVTMDGDTAHSNGAISGGYETKNNNLMELMELQSKQTTLSDELSDLNDKTLLLDLELDQINKLAFIKYLEIKIDFLTAGRLTLSTSTEEEKIKAKLEKQLLMAKVSLKACNEVSTQIKSNHIFRNQQLLSQLETIKDEISHLKVKETSFIEKMFATDENVEDGVSGGKKNVLLEKRGRLMKKAGITTLSNIKRAENINQLKNELKQILTELRPFAMFNFTLKTSDKMLDLERVKDGLEELKNEKRHIQIYLEYLEKFKEESKREMSEMVNDRFSTIYSYITGKKGMLEMNKENKGRNRFVDKIYIDDVLTSINTLSGGQKTVFTVSLILAIQQVTLSPFYVFDEIDANLDKEYATKVYELLFNMDQQVILSTFKQIDVDCNYIGITMNDAKESEVRKINKIEASFMQ